MIAGEQVEKAFKLIRDMYIFTNKRLFIIDKQGITGSKVEYMSVPYRSIKKFSRENAGTLDLDAEIKIWIAGDALPIKMEFRKDTHSSMDEIYRLLSQHVLS